MKTMQFDTNNQDSPLSIENRTLNVLTVRVFEISDVNYESVKRHMVVEGFRLGVEITLRRIQSENGQIVLMTILAAKI